MNEELEKVKVSLSNAKKISDIKSNPVVDFTVMSLIKTVPVIGDMIDSSMNKIIEDFQHKKEQEFIEIILNDKNIITSDMVNNVEFIMNFGKTYEAVCRLANNDKVKYFANLIKNGYLSGEHIKNDEFEEYLDILNSISYTEINCLAQYKLYWDNNFKKFRYDTYKGFVSKYAEENGISEYDVRNIFIRIKKTGFIEEEYEAEGGEVDENDNSFESLQVESNGFFINSSFQRFYDIVLNMDEQY